MKNTIKLNEDGYEYLVNHKCLIIHPNHEGLSVENWNIKKYQEHIQNQYRNTETDKELQFIQLTPQMIKNALGLTNQVIFEVTERCNLSCKYCGLGETYQQTTETRCQDMDWETAQTVLDFYIDKWHKERPKNFKKYCYIGFYGGEPLLKMQLIKKIVSYTEEYGKGLNFCYSMTTNGTLLNKHMTYLVEKGFIISVSMDGDKKMNSYRVYNNGKEVYNDLFTNLKKIQKTYPEYFQEKVEFLSVENNRNTNDGIIKFFEEEFDKRPEIHPLLSTMIANHDLWDSMRRQTKEEISPDNHYLSEYIELFSGNHYDHYRSLMDTASRIVKTPTGTCLPFSNRVFVTVRKDILACERIGFEQKLGKVETNKLSIDFEDLANFYNRIYDKFKMQCKHCFIKEVCEVCFLTDPKYLEPAFKCDEFYSKNRLKECISKSINTLRNEAREFDKKKKS